MHEGRLGPGGPDPAFHELNRSLGFDWRLAPYDVALSRAHAAMLAATGIISEAERDELHEALAQVEQELEQGSFGWDEDDEDVHGAIERRVTELAGEVGGKLHTARSRNDQVATDVALFVRAHARAAHDRVTELMRALTDRAEEHLDWPMPAYTHLQRAQPVYLSHHLLAYVWMLDRDRERLDFARAATDALPLGAGALAGVNFATDRGMVAEALGFTGTVPNSLDAVANRDFVLDFLSAATTCLTHLSRLGGEIVLWSSREFAFAEVADAWASGSSLMPQKKNPDAAELLRAKAPRIAGRLVALHGVLHGLPLTYNKDLQEDKEGLFDAADTLDLCLRAATGMVRSLTFDRDRLAAAAAGEDAVATDLADWLVRRGTPFRTAHGEVGALVRRALEEGRPLPDVAAEQHGEDVRELWAAGAALEGKVSEGGTSLARVREQLERVRALL